MNYAIEKLVEMRKQFKELTGFDYVPGIQLPTKHGAMKGDSIGVEQLYEEIEDQERVVRYLQSAESEGETLKEATAKVIRLKEEFKERTGCEYKSSGGDEAEASETLTDGKHIAQQIEDQGNLVRALKMKDPKSVGDLFFLLNSAKAFILREVL